MPPLTARRSFLVDALQLLGLSAIALSQPLYDLLGASAEFFVAHRATTTDVLVFALTVSFGVPLLLIAVEASVGLINKSVRAALHLLILCLVTSVFVIGVLNKFLDLDFKAAIAVSAALGIAIGFLVWRNKELGNIAAIFSVGALVFLVQFLFFSPASETLLGVPSQAALQTNKSDGTPVVFVVFDEFNPIALLDDKNQIDDVRFPNISALAKTSTWYPNAVSVQPQTIKAVPALMTGVMPGEGDAPPSVAAYPRNIFTLLGSGYRMNVNETVTELCPENYCPSGGRGADMRALASDIKVILGYIVLPPSFAAEHLPSLGEGWHNFGKEGASDRTDTRKVFFEKAAESRARGRVADFRKFVAGIQPGRSTLDFIHILLPHDNYQYLPDGKEYAGASTASGRWPDDQNTVDVAYQRYLLQLGMLDRLVGEMVDRLKQIGKFEEALFILVADHSRIFRAGEVKRELTSQTRDVLNVPLIVKLPGQKQGLKSEAFVSTIDLLPTIAEVVKSDADWTFTGTSLLSAAPPRTQLMTTYRGIEYELTPDQVARRDSIPDRVRKFGVRKGLDELVLSTEHDDLLGKSWTAISPEFRADGNTQVDSDLSLLERTDRPSHIKPVLVSGRIRIIRAEARLWVGISINDTIAAIAPVRHQLEGGEFVSVVPPRAVADGFNSVQFFLIEGVASERKLYAVEGWDDEGYRLSTAWDGEQVITRPTGEPLKIVPDVVIGYIYGRPESGKGIVSFWGWAADMGAVEPAQNVLLFVNGNFAKLAEVNLPSPDVVRVHGSDALAVSGFRFEIPQAIWNLDPSAIRAFAVSKSGIATEMTKRGILQPVESPARVN